MDRKNYGIIADKENSKGMFRGRSFRKEVGPRIWLKVMVGDGWQRVHGRLKWGFSLLPGLLLFPGRPLDQQEARQREAMR